MVRWKDEEAELEAVWEKAQADRLTGAELREHYLEAVEQAGL
jgi:hypothetical protein